MMNWNTTRSVHKEITGNVRERWPKITAEDLTSIAGKRDLLIGRLQVLYGYTKEEAEHNFDLFIKSSLF